MSSFAEILARNRWKRTIHRLGSGINLVAVILVLELISRMAAPPGISFWYTQKCWNVPRVSCQK